MKKKIALVFVGLLLTLTTFFAPITTATWHGLPDVQNDTYIVMGGVMNAKVQLQLGPLPIPPLNVPFVSRSSWLTPGVMWQDINFSMPLDPDGPGPLPTCVVFLTVPWQSIQSLEHVFFSGTLGFTRVKLLPLPGQDGMGWLYIVPGIADVDIYVFNTFMNNTNPPPYNVTNPPEIPIAMWTGPSPMAGAPAAVPGQLFYPFPDPGMDTLPGFAPLGPGSNDDGFGDGVPDPAGSSVLFIPMQLSVEAWNGTAWTFQFGGPFVMPMTTQTAFDTVVAPGRALDGETLAFTGAPWEDVASTGMWGANQNKKLVTYVCAWSFIQYYLSDGPPVVKLDLVYGMQEKKVKDVHVIPDIDCDNKVGLTDIVVAALAFGSRDEGSPALPGYDPTGEGEWPGPYPPYMPAPWYVDAQPNIAGRPFDARADLNNDGLIDIIDIVKIGIAYGETL
jgi:hypothetical protein